MKTLELKKKSLEELSKEYGQLTAVEQMECIGGGDGTFTNPWTYEQYNADYTCSGGYVDFCGQVIYVIPAAVCTAFRQAFSPSSDDTVKSNYSNSTLGLVGGYLGWNGDQISQYSGTIRFTNSNGSLDVNYYDNSWKGGGKYSMKNPLLKGKIMTGKQVGNFLSKAGGVVGIASLGMDFARLAQATSSEEKFEVWLDIAVDGISFIPGWGSAVSLAWSLGLREPMTALIEQFIY